MESSQWFCHKVPFRLQCQVFRSCRFGLSVTIVKRPQAVSIQIIWKSHSWGPYWNSDPGLNVVKLVLLTQGESPEEDSSGIETPQSSLHGLTEHGARRSCSGAARSAALQGCVSKGWPMEGGQLIGEVKMGKLFCRSWANTALWDRQEKVGSLWPIMRVCKRKELRGKMYSDNDV